MLDPIRLKQLLGADAELIAWMNAEAGAASLKDYSGNGHTLTPSAVEFEQRPLAPRLYGRSGRFDGASSTLTVADRLNFLHQGGEGSVGLIFCANTVAEAQYGLFHTFSSFSGGTGFFWRWDNRNGSKRLQARIQHTDGTGTTTLMGTSVVDGSITDEKPHLVWVTWSDTAGVIRTFLDGKVVDESAFTQFANTKASDYDATIGSMNGGSCLDGSVQGALAVSRALSLDEIGAIYDQSGLKDAGAYYQPFYVSEHTDSPRRYFAEYVNDYLTYVGKPAVDVWPKRRYGEATARGIKGAHDGSLQGDVNTSGTPNVDDHGHSLDFDGTTGRIDVPDHADFDFGSGDFTALSVFNIDDVSSDSRLLSTLGGTSGGWTLYVPGGGLLRAYISDGTSNKYVDSAAVSVGQDYLGAMVVGASAISVYLSSAMTTKAESVGSVDNTDPLSIGGQFDGLYYLNGKTSMGAVTPYSLTKVELDHLNVAAFDRTKRPQLDLSLPDYLSAYSGSIEFWTRHDRFKRFSDGDTIEHLSSFIEGDYAKQETASARPIYHADHIKFDGSVFAKMRNFDTAPANMTLFGVFDVADPTVAQRIFAQMPATATAPQFTIQATNGELRFWVRDNDAVTAISRIAITANTKYAVVARWDKASGAVTLDVGSSSDTTTATYTGLFASGEAAIGTRPDNETEKYTGEMVEFGRMNITLTDAQTADLITNLEAEHGV